MKQLTIKEIAPYLPYGLKIDTLKLENGYSIMTMCDKGGLSNISIGDVMDEYPYTKPILRPLSDIAKEIEHNGEKFVPIIEIAKLYSSTNDVESIKGAVTNFHYFKCYYGKSDYQILIINAGLRGWFSYYFNDDEPNCGINIVNEWEVRDKIFQWYFDIFGLIPAGLAIDINTLNE